MEEDIKNLIQTFMAVGPMVENALKSGQLFNPQAELTEPNPDVLCEYDVEIPMSEGFCVTANIFHSKKAAEKGERVPVDIELYPSSTFFAAGEALQLIIAGDEIIPSPPYKKSAEGNHGKHVLHFGGKYESYLLIPVIPQKKNKGI